MKTIDLTPTWGEWGSIFYSIALYGERSALKLLRSDMARALAAAQAFTEIQCSLPEDLAAQADAIIRNELAKQGVPLPAQRAEQVTE